MIPEVLEAIIIIKSVLALGVILFAISIIKFLLNEEDEIEEQIEKQYKIFKDVKDA